METKTADESKELSKSISSESPSAASKPSVPESQATAPVAEAPDPDEDDLDDLDDMLDEFSATKLDTEAKPKEKEPTKEQAESFSEDDFAKQLQADMANLLGEFDKSPEMQAQFEAMMKQLGDASEVTDTTAQPVSSSSKSPPSTTNPDDKFQATIKKTMERMQASGEKATAAAAEDDSEDFLAEMLKQMQAGALGGEGSEEDFSKMLMGMMEQLTNKEILYEPMKELDDKFPNWLEKNREKTGKEDLERFLEQQRLVREIVARFEERGYSDEDVKSREYIVDRMQKMQAAGSPPADLVGSMEAAQEAFGGGDGPEDGCPTQ